MSTKGRVDRLAGALGSSDDLCPCGPSDLRVRYSGEPEDESPPQVCGNCGRAREVVRLRVVYADEVRP